MFTSEQIAEMNKAVVTNTNSLAEACTLTVIHRFPDGEVVLQGFKYDSTDTPNEWKDTIEGGWDDMGK